MARPSPVPPKRRVVEASACEKAEKIFSRAADGMPMPVRAAIGEANHHAALHYTEVPALLKDLRERNWDPFAVSPRTPGSVDRTVSSTCAGNCTAIGLPLISQLPWSSCVVVRSSPCTVFSVPPSTNWSAMRSMAGRFEMHAQTVSRLPSPR